MEIRNYKQSMKTTKLRHSLDSTKLHVIRHTLKGPLTRMKMYAEGLLTGLPGKLNKDQREYAELIYQSCEELLRLINRELSEKALLMTKKQRRSKIKP